MVWWADVQQMEDEMTSEDVRQAIWDVLSDMDIETPRKVTRFDVADRILAAVAPRIAENGGTLPPRRADFAIK